MAQGMEGMGGVQVGRKAGRRWTVGIEGMVEVVVVGEGETIGAQKVLIPQILMDLGTKNSFHKTITMSPRHQHLHRCLLACGLVLQGEEQH